MMQCCCCGCCPLHVLISCDDFTGHALNEQHLLTSRAFREGADKGQSAATAPAHNASTATRLPISDGLLEVELSSSLRFTEDDRLHEVELSSSPGLCSSCIDCRTPPIIASSHRFSVRTVGLSDAAVLSAHVPEGGPGTRASYRSARGRHEDTSSAPMQSVRQPWDGQWQQ